jgi:hypothetical protein
MNCVYCDGRVPFLQRLKRGPLFCSAGHHENFYTEQRRLVFERLREAEATLVEPPARAEGLIFPRPSPLGGHKISPRGAVEPLGDVPPPVLPLLDLSHSVSRAFSASNAA